MIIKCMQRTLYQFMCFPSVTPISARATSLLFASTTLLIIRSLATVSIMRAVNYEPGGPELMSIGDREIPTLKKKEVLIKVVYSAINRADTLQRRGLYPAPAGESDILGLEAVGTVDKLDAECTKWKVGDRVMALLPGGGNAEYVAVYEDHVMKIPDELPFVKAAAIPEVWLTAYQLLHFVGNLQPNDTVLIHAGGSGVGTAAVQLVTSFGSKAIVTAGSQHKIDVAKGLGAVEGFNYKEGNFAEKVLELTDGKGVNMILDCVGASFWKSNAQSLGMEGTWVLYGLMGGMNIDGDILAQILRKRITLTGSTLRTRSREYKAKLVADFAEKALPLFTSGILQTIVETTFPLDKISDAHKMMEENKNTGKILIKVEMGEKDEL